MLADGVVQAHIKNVLVPTYRTRYYSMTRAIREELEPRGVSIISNGAYEGQAIAGGFFIFLRLPSSLEGGAKNFAQTLLRDHMVKVAPGEIFSVSGDPQSEERARGSYAACIRLCWAWNEEDALLDSIRRIAQALDSKACGVKN